MDRSPLNVEVVSADRQVWQGEAINIIARTTEGDIGILPGHEPLIAALVPCAVEIVTTDGRSESMAIDGGFMTVADGNVWVLSDKAVLAQEVSRDDAHRQAAELRQKLEAGQASDEEKHQLRMLHAQLRAAERDAS